MPVYTAPPGTPLPRSVDAFPVSWQEPLQAITAGFRQLGEVLRAQISTINGATTALAAAATPEPKHTPPFWAINPTKQKRA
ncbi:hypothetical protein [Rhodococcoides fascians]|uniref:hypothetical protein n=1 Tax=Rhodococcoides fascians TaxID=1828 RepID=UPI00050C2F2D|nr:hypothetical protein [Rhodococcus fascians]